VKVKRALVLVGVTAAIVIATAAPAFAHATLLTTEPQPGGVFQTSPPFVNLRFDQPVQVSLGGIRVFTSGKSRVDTGAPEHPGGAGDQVRVTLPKLSPGTYVVTWRVISADSHPVEGAFTFGVGASSSGQAKGGLEASLLSAQSGSRSVGIVYGFVRGVVYAALALLIGGAVFVAFVWPAGRRNRRARRLVWAGWIALAVSTVLALVLEGLYASGLPLSKFFDVHVFDDVLGTRFGHVSLLRLALLALAYPLLRMLFPRRDPASVLPKWWAAAAVVLATGLALTPGLDGHASTGRWVPFAVPADVIHVLAMCCWLGGLAVLCFVVLPRRDVEELEGVLPRYSALAFGAVIALIVTGGFQAYRQVGSIEALKSTDYGKLLIAKLVAFAALIIAAAFSREVVNRRFRTYEYEDDDEGAAVAVAPGPSFPQGEKAGVGTMVRDRAEPAADEDDEGYDDESEIRRLRRSVLVEVIIAVIIVSITVLLVNAAPARTVSTAPVSFTLKSSKLWVDVTIAPGIAGGNDVHVTTLPLGGGFTNVENLQVQLTKVGSNLPAFDVPIRILGPGHGYAPLFDIPYPGQWRIIVRAQTSATDEEVLTGTFTLR
jgi:copper transport protein